ncbi:MAG: alpha/beta hydrolase [Deltaproteobacteria bacterium]|nr:alpha/beta hydrolase [Deltaproteobacteria bacterium]
MPKVDAGGVELSYQLMAREGREGAPLAVYIHGLIMDNHTSALFTFAGALSERRDLLLYDLRGHGASARPAWGYTVGQHALDLLALTEALGLGGRPLYLVGCSFGGAVALEVAARAPGRVWGVALVDGHPNSAAFLAQLGGDLAASDEERAGLIARHFEHWLSRDLPRKRERLAARARGLLTETSLLADLAADAARLAAAPPPPVLAPVLALYGERSDAYPLARARLAGAPRVAWRVFAGRSHALLWEEREGVAGALAGWGGEG